MADWRWVPGFEGAYKISTDSQVWSCFRNRTLSQRKTGGGYMRVSLNRRGKRRSFLVHRLVAEAFLPNPRNAPQVNHINHRRDDNRIENLEWATAAENQKHSFDAGRRSLLGEKHTHAKLKDDQVIEIIQRYASGGVTQYELADEYDVTQGHVSALVNGKTPRSLAIIAAHQPDAGEGEG